MGSPLNPESALKVEFQNPNPEIQNQNSPFQNGNEMSVSNSVAILLCRICGKSNSVNEVLINIFSQEGAENNLSEKIKFCFTKEVRFIIIMMHSSHRSGKIHFEIFSKVK